jgi:hypothetical protein
MRHAPLQPLLNSQIVASESGIQLGEYGLTALLPVATDRIVGAELDRGEHGSYQGFRDE